MDWGVLVVVGVFAWISVSILLSLLVGRLIRRRDEPMSVPSWPVTAEEAHEDRRAS